MPLFRKRKTLWNIKELEGYFNKLDSHVSPEKLTVGGETHQALDGLIRPNWDGLHSLEQDFIMSWFIEYQAVREQKEHLQSDVRSLEDDFTRIKQTSEAKIDELNKTLQSLTTDLEKVKNELDQKTQLSEDLADAIQNQQLSGEQLKEKSEKRIGDMKVKMIEKRKEFESNQLALASQFQTRVLELDEEKLVLNETLEKTKQSLLELEEENLELERQNRLLHKFREKIQEILIILSKIPINLLKGEDN